MNRLLPQVVNPPLLRLRPEDNVAVLIRAVESGEEVEIDSRPVVFPDALGLGHKIALRPISEGEKIVKYGFPIGSATRAIEAGEHVHLHNLKSDYLPTYTLAEGMEYHGRSD